MSALKKLLLWDNKFRELQRPSVDERNYTIKAGKRQATSYRSDIFLSFLRSSPSYKSNTFLSILACSKPKYPERENSKSNCNLTADTCSGW